MVQTWKMDRVPMAFVKGGRPFLSLAATFLAGLPSFALADGPRSGYGHPMMGDGWGWTGMIFGPIMMIVVLASVVAVVVLIVRWLGGGHPPASAGTQRSEKTALDILRERFARGEIDKDEFEERRRILEG